MLILTRRADEALLIGDDIVVTVLEIAGSHVRLSIDAPPDAKILRDEIAFELEDDRHVAAVEKTWA